MRRDSAQAPLHLLLLGLLVACGSVQDVEQDAAAQEALGTQQSALCYGVSVSGLTVAGVSTYDGVMAGAGGFTVSGGANAVRLEYYVDGALKYYEERTGTSGSWNYSYGGFACGSHSFQVKAYPMIVDSAGNRATCSSSPTWSAVHYPSETCPIYCGNGVCDGYESRQSCPEDCGSPIYCGNGICEQDEEWNCSSDCGGGGSCGGRSICGDGSCCPDSGICPGGQYYCPTLSEY